MKYDFSTVISRDGTGSLAVEQIPIPGVQVRTGFSKIPMWIADMSFATVPSIPRAIAQRLEHPLFGYFLPEQDYFDSVIRWQCTRNGVSELAREHIAYENGVMGGVLNALNVLCSRGDPILIHAPTYTGFTSNLKNNGYRIIHSQLVQDSQGVWRMDFDDMDRKLKEHKIHAAIFCSPHNPCGRVWEPWEVARAMEIYRDNNVMVVADEIWSDILMPGHRHTPTQSVSEDARQRTVALYAPSKTFNLAGLVGAYRIVYNPLLRDRLNRESALTHYNSMNLLSMHALIGAYSPEGEAWLEELRQVLAENIDYAHHYISTRFQGVSAAKPQGTYMLFLDCTQWCAQHKKTLDELLRAGVEVGVIWQDGRAFHGPCHIRMNLALPTSLLKEALSRLDQHVFHP